MRLVIILLRIFLICFVVYRYCGRGYLWSAIWLALLLLAGKVNEHFFGRRGDIPFSIAVILSALVIYFLRKREGVARKVEK